jgi:hypothetical protein
MDVKVPYESDEQIAFVKWFKAQYPGVLIFSVPNGGSRRKREALKLQHEGVVKGVPDLFIPEWRLFIEMKRQKGGVVSPDQKQIMAELTRVGYVCQVCNGWRAAADFVLTFRRSVFTMD